MPRHIASRVRVIHLAALVCAVALVACDTTTTSPGPASAGPGSSAEPPGSGGPSASSAPPAGSSAQALIAADLGSGAIDLGTSLVYRAWALFADARLPERYDAAPSLGRDTSLFADIAASLPDLS